MKNFENIDVKSVREAVGLLQKFQSEKKSAAVVGGGSEYLQLMKVRVATPDYLVNLKAIPGMSYIKEESGGFRIGALTTLSELEENPAVRQRLLFLSQAAGEAASPQIRNAGTVAGNLCQRPFCWYFRSAGHNCLRKVGQGWYHAIVSVAAVVQSSGGAAREARVVLGGVAPVPWRAAKAEEFLRGKKIDEATAEKAGEIALAEAKPMKDNVYKVDLAKNLVQRALLASA